MGMGMGMVWVSMEEEEEKEEGFWFGNPPDSLSQCHLPLFHGPLSSTRKLTFICEFIASSRKVFNSLEKQPRNVGAMGVGAMGDSLVGCLYPIPFPFPSTCWSMGNLFVIPLAPFVVAFNLLSKRSLVFHFEIYITLFFRRV